MVSPRPSRPPGWATPSTAPDGVRLSAPWVGARLAYGELFGGYQVLERLGAGGMAEVFSALKLGPHGFAKPVALKCMLPELAAEPRFVAMFCDEARVMARLQHPCLVQILDFGEVDGRLYMALEHIDGLSCAKLLRAVAAKRQALPPSAVLFVADQVLAGLGYAHERCDEDGRPLLLVHRDVSPGNILVGRGGEVKLTDFGILKGATLSRRTLPGELKGKLGYMSPEQVVGGEVDARSDLFTLGIVLAELLLGRPLFPGSSEMEVLDRICRGDLSVITRHGRHLPPLLKELLVRALAQDPRDRFESARHFREATDEAARALGLGVSAAELAPWVASELLPSQSGTRPRVEVQLPRGPLSPAGRPPLRGAARGVGRRQARAPGPAPASAPAQASSRSAFHYAPRGIRASSRSPTRRHVARRRALRARAVTRRARRLALRKES
ncbi:MAG: serine/threonine protein kinase [Polyangiaceae bacterium]|nr:serine/threonine protein kinase [Polyangiaceae bacterium]